MNWHDLTIVLLVGTGVFFLGRSLYGILVSYTKWVQRKTMGRLLEKSEKNAEAVVRSILYGDEFPEHKITELIVAVNVYGDRRAKEENARVALMFNKLFAKAQKEALKGGK